MVSTRIGLVLLLLGAVSCAHGRYDIATRRLCSKGACYRIGALDDPWQLLRVDGAQLAFINPDSNAIIESNVTCREDSEAAPLSTLTEHLLIGYTDRAFQTSELTRLQGRDARHSVVTAKLDGVPVELSLYVAKRNGCIIDLDYVSSPSVFAADQPLFARFVSAFVDENRL